MKKYFIKLKKKIYKHIIAFYIINLLLILLFFNVAIRNQKITELELKNNELQFKIDYLNFIEEDNKNQ